MQAARLGDVQKIEQYVSNGSDINARSQSGWTALMFASWEGHEQVVVRLLDAGADPNLISQRIARNTQVPTPKTTALAQAIGNNHLSIAEKLMSYGAHIDPMSVALAGGLEDPAFLEKMYEYGADLNRDAGVIGLSTAFNQACTNGRLENVVWMIEHHVDVDSDALKIAAGLEHMDILQYLIAHDVDQKLFSEKGLSTAFWHAATKQNTPEHNFVKNREVIEFLLSHGADKNYRPESDAIHGYGKNNTVLEFLKQRRIEAVERIKLNRYGVQHQQYEKNWLEHRDSIIAMLETDSSDS